MSSWERGEGRRRNILLTATHSMISTYFGSMTIVLKFPLTKAASTKGLQRYKGFATAGATDDGVIIGIGGGISVVGEDVTEGTGVVRLGPR